MPWAFVPGYFHLLVVSKGSVSHRCYELFIIEVLHDQAITGRIGWPHSKIVLYLSKEGRSKQQGKNAK